jgi:hypothetical protein
MVDGEQGKEEKGIPVVKSDRLVLIFFPNPLLNGGQDVGNKNQNKFA